MKSSNPALQCLLKRNERFKTEVAQLAVTCDVSHICAYGYAAAVFCYKIHYVPSLLLD